MTQPGPGPVPRRALAGAACVLLANLPLLADLPARAQTTPPRLAFDLSGDLRQAANPDLAIPAQSATRAALGLGLAYADLTQDQDIRLGLTGALRGGEGLEDPTLTLSYKRQGANAALSLDLTRSDLAVDLSEPRLQPDGTLSYSDLAAVSGRVITTGAGLRLQLGQAGPWGLDLTAQAQARDYSQTNDPSVQDSRGRSLGLNLQLRDVAGGDLTLGLGAQDSEEDSALETQSQSRSVTLTYGRALDGATMLQASLGTTSAERRDLGLVTQSSEGLTGALGLTRSLAQGQAGLVLDLARDARGARQGLRLTREVKLATGAFAAELGLSARPGEAAQTVARLSWSQELAADQLSVSLSRQVASTTDADTLQTSLQANWRHSLSQTRSLGLSYGVTAIEGTGEEPVDAITRQDLKASFTQDLARDWALTAGIELRSLDRDSTGLAEDQAVFVTIARRFVLLP